MLIENLPSPGVINAGLQLRTIAAKAISFVETVAAITPGGKVTEAAKLQAFFTACATAAGLVAGYAPVNTVAPAVTGTATNGSTLTTTNGTWTGDATITYTRQWCRNTAGVWAPIAGATGTTYVLTAADVGKTIRCDVTATNNLGVVSASSNVTATVA